MKRILTMLLLTLALAGCEIKVTPYSKPVNSFWTLDSSYSVLTNNTLNLRGIITDNRSYNLSSDWLCDYSIRLNGSRSVGLIVIEADCLDFLGSYNEKLYNGAYHVDNSNQLSIVWSNISLIEYYR